MIIIYTCLAHYGVPGTSSHLILPGAGVRQARQRTCILQGRRIKLGVAVQEITHLEPLELQPGSHPDTPRYVHRPETGLTFGQKYCFLFAHVESILMV